MLLMPFSKKSITPLGEFIDRPGSCRRLCRHAVTGLNGCWIEAGDHLGCHNLDIGDAGDIDQRLLPITAGLVPHPITGDPVEHGWPGRHSGGPEPGHGLVLVHPQGGDDPVPGWLRSSANADGGSLGLDQIDWAA